ncbi:MAG: hypothetical protein RLQ73_28190 [Hoeflea sp. D1-CHI-28]
MDNEQPKLAQFFSDFRAEWPQDLFRQRFIRPPYFSRLIEPRPSILEGGRGTGKTTALKSLRFDSAAAQLNTNEGVTSLDYFGVYVKINKNRVRAFQGPDLSQETWDQAFSHYFNLLTCHELCLLTQWLQLHFSEIPSPTLKHIGAALGQDDVSRNADELLDRINDQIISLELFINNPAQATRPIFSIKETPIEQFAIALKKAGFLKHRLIYCCVDEYENLTPTQQSILNTYLKNCQPPLAYKIGLRRNGLKTRFTIDRDDQINTPDDYLEIDIAEADFPNFAREVVSLRLTLARQSGTNVPESLDDFLADISMPEEARRLGASRIATKVRQSILGADDRDLIEWADAIPDEVIYFLGYWSAGGHGDVIELARDWMENPTTWNTRIGNYGQASLFWLSRGRKGARLRKFYCGTHTLIALASGNIRYFLELFDESIREQLSSASDSNCIILSPEAQTAAAKAVGRRRLGQIESLTQHGIDVKRMILAIGKVFFEFARDPNKAPETNAFVLTGDATKRAEIEDVLNDGVAHLAFEMTARTKATSHTEMRDAEYRLHPIYAPFFEYSHRRKRRATFDAADLLLLRSNPKRAIANLLGDTHAGSEDDAPEQLRMFAPFYEGGDE